MITEIERCANTMLARTEITRDELRNLRNRIVNGEPVTFEELDALNPENYGGYLTNTVEETHDWAIMMRCKRTDHAAWGFMYNILFAREYGVGERKIDLGPMVATTSLAAEVADYAQQMVDICATFYEDDGR